MSFDHQKFREAHRPWSFTTADGRTFTARHISAPQFQAFNRRLVAAGPNVAEQLRAVRWALRRAFPWRLSYKLRGDPVTIIMEQLEPAARREAFADFFDCLRGETGPTPPQSPRTNGTPSSGPRMARSA